MPWSRSSKDSHNNPSMQVPGCRDGGKSRRTIGGRGTRIHSWRGKTFFLTYIPVIRKKAREARYTQTGRFFLSCFLHPSIPSFLFVQLSRLAPAGGRGLYWCSPKRRDVCVEVDVDVDVDVCLRRVALPCPPPTHPVGGRPLRPRYSLPSSLGSRKSQD